jgi:hypothetical protein
LGEAPTATSEGDNEIAELLRQLTSRLNSLRIQIAEITASDAGDTTLLLRQKYLDLYAKKWVSQQAEAITSEIARLKETESYDRWILKTRTTGISRKAGELSEKLVTDAYVGRFNTELAKLGGSRVQVVLVKTGTKQGEVRHSIQLKDTSVKGAKVLDILSEGESRIVSLAAFLADVTGRRSTSPFIFDDPISSLDQVFEERVIARLIELSKERQVVVFTHRLSFLGIMSDIAGANLHEVQIRREPWGTGEPCEVSLAGKNPEKALRKIQNERLAIARRVYESEGSHSYYVHSKAICSDLRILVERIVETILLADVVKRHRRAVHTQGKVSELAKITQADSALIDKMMTKYSCFEHSQSSESPVELLDPDELDRDIVEILDWIKEFKSR